MGAPCDAATAGKGLPMLQILTKNLFEASGLRVVDAEINGDHGGSFAVTACRSDALVPIEFAG